MRPEWIEDLLAVLRTGSLKQAAEERHITQTAFSRRIRTIEDYVGITLIDRTRKPAQLRKSLQKQQSKLEKIRLETRDLISELRQSDRRAQKKIAIAAQHTTATFAAPALIQRIVEGSNAEVTLHSANRDECFFLLATNQADLALIYRHRNETTLLAEHFTEECYFPDETLIPVFGEKHRALLDSCYKQKELPIVTYPKDIFLGGVTDSEILMPLRDHFNIKVKVTTGLTHALAQLALEGIGIAWVPESVAKIISNEVNLLDLRSTLPSARLHLIALRIVSKDYSDFSKSIWKTLQDSANELM
jgi:DNA-binding transcriptional LysR family regulator